MIMLPLVFHLDHHFQGQGPICQRTSGGGGPFLCQENPQLAEGYH